MTEPPKPPPIAANLRRLKEEAGVTWRQLAQALDVHERQVAEWSRVDGASYVASWETCVALADYFTAQLDRRVQPGEFYLEPALA